MKQYRKPKIIFRKTAMLLFCVLFAAVMLVGCGSTRDSGGSSGSSEAESDAGGNTLVVYFSATGNTKAVAETIADTLNADTFEITPKESYSDEDLDWNNEDSRVNKEHENESLQDQVELTAVTPDNWDSYDTVFLGYPIWWGGAAWPVNQFVQKNDFSGKTVIPFCTSASSGIGESGSDLAKMAGTGNWKNGKRFPSDADKDEVRDWAEKAVTK